MTYPILAYAYVILPNLTFFIFLANSYENDFLNSISSKIYVFLEILFIINGY